tara:strand:- start:1145 stop:1651 length:507 start_codon:yes stop_codon:yes gene_type:complete
MRFANSEDWMKSMQGSNSATSFVPELTSLADLGSIAAADSGAASGTPPWRQNAGGWAEYWDPFLADIGKKSEETTPVDPVEEDPEDTPFRPTVEDSSHPWIKDEAGNKIERNPYYNPFWDSEDEISRWNDSIPNPNVPGGFGKWEWGYGSDPFNDKYSTSMERLRGTL